MQNHDTHSDLLVLPTGGGVQLIKPEKNFSSRLMSVKNLFDLPIKTFFVNQDGGQFVDMNELHFDSYVCPSLGYSSRKDLTGKKLESIYRKDAAAELIRNSCHVLAAKEMKIFDEVLLRVDDVKFSSLVLKFPWFNESYSLIGVFGFSILTDNKILPTGFSLSESLELIAKTGLLGSDQRVKNFHKFVYKSVIDDVYLSQQEMRCIKLLIRGMTAKMIARTLKISHRTVESYLEILKLKFRVNTKIELIDKVVSFIFPHEEL